MKQSGESEGDQKARPRGNAAGVVPDERRGCDANRCDRGGDRRSGAERIWAGLEPFPTEQNFVSHATLVPRMPKSGGKPVKKKRNRASTRVAAALRMAALSMRHSPTALGAYYRRMAQRIAGDIAVFATARKLATLIYRLLRWGQPYVDEGAEAFEQRYRQQHIKAWRPGRKNLAIN